MTKYFKNQFYLSTYLHLSWVTLLQHQHSQLTLLKPKSMVTCPVTVKIYNSGCEQVNMNQVNVENKVNKVFMLDRIKSLDF